MFCKYCGRQMKPEALVCSWCGKQREPLRGSIGLQELLADRETSGKNASMYSADGSMLTEEKRMRTQNGRNTEFRRPAEDRTADGDERKIMQRESAEKIRGDRQRRGFAKKRKSQLLIIFCICAVLILALVGIFQVQINGAKEQNIKLQTQVDELRSNVEKLEADAQSAAEQKSEMETSYEERLKKLEEQISGTEEENQELLSRITELETKMQEESEAQEELEAQEESETREEPDTQEETDMQEESDLQEEPDTSWEPEAETAKKTGSRG